MLGVASTLEDSSARSRGVLASYEDVTPTRRDTDITKTRQLSFRDGIMLAIGVASMWGLQVATQKDIRSDIRDLGTKFEVSQQLMQRQIDEIRKQSSMNEVQERTTALEMSELKGFLIGSGMKGVPGAKVR